ncbi:MAG TPA: segregation/condensation protein A [Deltaproteobacteria bacterium]|nr:segregation/condensation protein A [Deltaproteobacteria bacterium]
MEPCRVRLPSFEGPLDLLLHLVKREKLDIRDLPIALVAEQYMEYLDRMRAMDVNIASEYLLMAATLLYLKSKALLPSAPEDEGEEDIKGDLAFRLLRYKAFKEAAEELSRRPLLDRDVFTRPPLEGEPEERWDADLAGLMEGLRRLRERTAEGEGPREISPEGLDLRFKMVEILERLEASPSLRLMELDGGELVVAFVAVLELARLGLVALWQEVPFGDIWVASRAKGAKGEELWA